ncbi:hypothetical protein H5410_032303 [Solanum commersonii]|uniref:Uncharacterized protein n=1 Tax=Solanum commersonii TaxID=4109 RepID=A0A9J5YLT7_SOLCO|nr:hypothetical protein H5410_032303 [Solanum commersonii]
MLYAERQEFNKASSQYQYSRLNQVHLEEEGQVVGKGSRVLRLQIIIRRAKLSNLSLVTPKMEITELEIDNWSEKQSKARPVKDRRLPDQEQIGSSPQKASVKSGTDNLSGLEKSFRTNSYLCLTRFNEANYRFGNHDQELTTAEKETEREPISMQKAAPYLLSTKVAIKNHERAPKSPDSTKYDLLRYPKSGKESL